MKRIVILPSFERTLRKLNPQQKNLIGCSLEEFNRFLCGGYMPAGLGFKKINHDKYELRVDIRLRIIIKSEADIYYLVLVGNHDDVRRYLRRYR